MHGMKLRIQQLHCWSLGMDDNFIHTLVYGGPLLQSGLALTPTWISNYMSSKAWNETTCPATAPLSFGNGWIIPSTLDNGCDYLCTLGFASIHFSHSNPWLAFSYACMCHYTGVTVKYKAHQIPKSKRFSSRLAFFFAQSIEARC